MPVSVRVRAGHADAKSKIGVLTVVDKPFPQALAGERSFQLLVDGVKDYAIYMMTPEGHITSWNTGAQRIKGYLADEIIGQHFSIFYSEEDRARGEPAHALEVAMREGKSESEGWRIRKDGSRFWASGFINAITDSEGKFIGYAKVTRDITKRKSAQEALRESDQRFRLLVEGVTDYAMYMLSPQGNITNWNVGAERIKGYSADEAIGTHFSRFYTEEDQAAGEPARALEIAAQKGKYEEESWRVRRDGSRFLANIIIEPLRDDAGNLVGFAEITRDITERQKTTELLEQTRARLYQAQKMESLGKLTGGVAHDFNNVLQIIGGNLQLLESTVNGDANAKRRLRLAAEAVERGSKLSLQLLAFARRQPLRPVVVNLARVVHGMDDLLRRAMNESIQIETIVAGGLWNTMVDPHQLENVILNIAINSRDAMGDQGKLTIEVGNATLDSQYAMSEPDMPAGEYVMLAISDTGNGMSAEIMERVFDPFFTTKPEGEGTGLGLSMAYGFIKQSGGHIKIYSELGHGTTLRIYLPRALDAEAELPAKLQGPVIGGTETILVVEDDPKVQSTVVDMLTDLGYRVLKANDGQSALSVVESGVPIDLLFTDVVMPGPLRSVDLAKRAKQHLPDIAILFTSGYTHNAIVHGGRLDPDVELLSKPYRREDLARKLRRMFANRRAQLPGHTAATDGGIPDPAPAASIPLSILVVEDNKVLRQLICDMAGMLGHQVQGVASAEEATDLLAGANVDVLLTDINLPGMSGVDLAKKVVQQVPRIKVIFASGYGAPSESDLGFAAIVLPKPYTLEQLQKALSEI
jgi:PAS domain S-box-containing protein